MKPENPGNKKGRGLGACGLGKTLSVRVYASEHLQTTGLVKLKKLKKKNRSFMVFMGL